MSCLVDTGGHIPIIPFESTIAYSNMIADSSTTKEDLDREAAEHKQAEESFTRF